MHLGKYKFLHQGHCAGSPNPYVPPPTNQKTLEDCANECISRPGVQYFAYIPGSHCVCYTRECNFDGQHMDHMAYEIIGQSVYIIQKSYFQHYIKCNRLNTLNNDNN